MSLRLLAAMACGLLVNQLSQRLWDKILLLKYFLALFYQHWQVSCPSPRSRHLPGVWSCHEWDSQERQESWLWLWLWWWWPHTSAHSQIWKGYCREMLRYDRNLLWKFIIKLLFQDRGFMNEVKAMMFRMIKLGCGMILGSYTFLTCFNYTAHRQANNKSCP